MAFVVRLQNMKPWFTTALPAFALLTSCASTTDGAKGINKREMHALEENYYWKSGYSPPQFAKGDLERLMDRSADPTLDGEYAEGQASSVAVALATVGDEHFASTLATRSEEAQSAVIGDVSYMWRHYNLRYPMTQAIASSIQQGEQGSGGQPATRSESK